MKLKHLIPVPIVTLAAIFCLPSAGFAQSILQSAGNYALLGGTLISVGGPGPTTISNGNVGLWSAATTNITGFPPATVTGITAGGSAAAIIATSSLTTGQAYADVQKAHVGLAGMASTANVSNVDLGTMAPLFSGVYTFNGAATQTGALILDAQGQNGVTWVFQVGTSLTTAANSTVTFINLGSNGGSDLGVFWNTGAGITIGDNNTTLGNYIAGTSISFTGITTTAGVGGTRVLALAAISFAGPGAINALGGPGGSDFSGGLMYDPITGAVVLKPLGSGSGGGGSSGTVLLSPTGTYTPGTAGSILVAGTTLATTTATVIDGNLANGTTPASLAVVGATVTLTGTNSYTGGTTVNGGTLTTGSANLPTNQGVVLSNSGTLVFNQPAEGSFGGVISGAGVVAKQGTGALTVTGANTYTGGTNITGGTLVASTASLPANQSVTIANGSTLAFNQVTTGSFGGSITGGGTVRKSGTGTVTLTRATTSPLDLQAGSVYFTDGLGTTTIASGAFLGGTGTINGNLINSGILSPGNSPGTITVTGNYTQTTTGTLVIELASGTSFDHLVINGTAALAGTLQIDLLNGYNPLGESFTFLTAAGGISGQFTTVNGNALTTSRAAIGATVTYAPTAVRVAFSQLPFAGFAQTPNQVAVANAAQLSPAITVALDAVPQASQFPAALNALSPQGYRVWSGIAFADATSLAGRILRDDRTIAGYDDYYFDAGQRRGRARTDLDVGENAYTSSSGLIGVNHALDDGTTVGGYFAFGKTTAGLGSAGSQTTVKNQTLGVRSAWARGPLFAEAMLAYGFYHYDATRPVVFPGTVASATGSTRGHQWTTGITAGQHLTAGRVVVSPFLGLLMNRWSAKDFTETGAGAFDTTVAGQSAHSLRSQLGLDVRFNLGRLQPHARAAWLHEFSDGSRAMNASWGNVNYAVATRRASRDSVQYSTGLDLVFGPAALLYTELTAQSGGEMKVVSEWRVGVAIRY